MNNIHLIMPMGGRGSRFQGLEEYPKPLIPLHERPFFYWATQSIVKNIEVQDITFVILKEHIERFCIDEQIKKYYPAAKIAVIPEVLNGAVLTCREGIKNLTDDGSLIFNDCDHAFRSREFETFCRSIGDYSLDGALISFLSTEPVYSYLQKDSDGNVIQTVEKKVISNEAICGCYYFRNKQIFSKMIGLYLKECSYKEYFVSGMYNTMARKGMVIKSFPADYHIPFGIPEEYEDAKKDLRIKELL